MSQKPDGGPAFPRGGSDHDEPEDGMSLRDWFAGQVVNGIAAALGREFPADTTPESLVVNLSISSYVIADAMLAERNKEGEPDA